MDSKVIIGVIGVFVIGVGVYGYTANQKEEAMMAQKMEEEKAIMEQKAMEEKAMMEQEVMEGDSMMKDDESMMKDDGAMMEKKEDGAMMEKAGVYAPYEASKLAMAETGKVVLFFKASWCPSCRALDADIKASLSDIPGDVTILEVDYDRATDLRQKYGVTMQHTLVQVDKNGNQLNKWTGGSTLEDLVKNIK